MAETKKERDIRHVKVNNIAQRVKSSNDDKCLIASLNFLYKQCNSLRKATLKRKTQNIRDHNLINIFKEDYPVQFEDSLNKYLKKYKNEQI